MGYVTYLWYAFLALHPWGYVSTAVVLLIAFLKRKVISAAVSTGWKKLDSWFWEWIKRKVQAQPQAAQTGQAVFRTYKGSFQDYYYQSHPFDHHILEMTCDGSSVKLEVVATSLFNGVKHGDFVEVDTEAAVGPYPELVKRVRKPISA